MDRHQVSVGLLFLRLIGGTLLISGRAWTWSAMIDTNRFRFDAPFGGAGGEFSWFLTLFSECLCTILVMLGVFTKFTAVPPMVVMVVAALVLPGGTAWSTRELYLLYALPFFVLTFTGPGDYSVDGRLSSWATPR
ncbi:MAG: DoxX family protein [Candidatus Binatia bacterium]